MKTKIINNCSVFLCNEKVGNIAQEDNSYQFSYDNDWLANHVPASISPLALPALP